MNYLPRVVEVVLLPPFGPLLFVMLGLGLLRWHPRTGKSLAWLGVWLSVALASPMVVGTLLAPLETSASLATDRLGGAGAIVILGGGVRSMAPELGGETVNGVTLERLRYGAKLARETGLPVLLSGGPTKGGQAEARLMARSLKDDFGMEARWVEDRSMNTADNARLSAAMLKKVGIGNIALVTHAAHMRRAMAAFEASGVHALPAPTAFFGRPASDGLLAWLPSANGAYAGWYATHEWAGLIAQKLSAFASDP